MAVQLKNPKKQFQLNPNWAQLRQQLKSNGFQKQLSIPSETENPNSILGKLKSRSSDDSGDARPNPLIPTSLDSSFTDVIAMDCEMVGVSSVGNKSALGRVTLVNQWGNVIYDEYVRPVERVVDFRTKISGIRPQHLKKDIVSYYKGMQSLINIVPAALNNINTKFIVLDKGRIAYEGQQKTCLALVADETAAVHFQMWGDECDAFEAGDIIQLENGIFSYIRNNRNNHVLRAGKRGKAEKVGEFTMAYVEKPNMSEIHWVPDPKNPKIYMRVANSQFS